jgi:hypothetical protein
MAVIKVHRYPVLSTKNIVSETQNICVIYTETPCPVSQERSQILCMIETPCPEFLEFSNSFCVITNNEFRISGTLTKYLLDRIHRGVQNFWNVHRSCLRTITPFPEFLENIKISPVTKTPYAEFLEIVHPVSRIYGNRIHIIQISWNVDRNDVSSKDPFQIY